MEYPATLRKVSLFHGCFSRFSKLYKWYQIAQNISFGVIGYGEQNTFNQIHTACAGHLLSIACTKSQSTLPYDLISPYLKKC